MKIYQVVFSFLDPSQAMGTIIANSPEEAVEKIKADIAENSPSITNFEVISVTEVLDNPDLDAEDVSANRTLN